MGTKLFCLTCLACAGEEALWFREAGHAGVWVFSSPEASAVHGTQYFVVINLPFASTIAPDCLHILRTISVYGVIQSAVLEIMSSNFPLHARLTSVGLWNSSLVLSTSENL